MHETSKIGCASSAGDGRRAVIESPRRSGGPGHSMVLKRGDGQENIERVRIRSKDHGLVLHTENRAQFPSEHAFSIYFCTRQGRGYRYGR